MKTKFELKNKNKNVINIKINTDKKPQRKKRQAKKRPAAPRNGVSSYSLQPPTIITQQQPMNYQPFFTQQQSEHIKIPAIVPASLATQVQATNPDPVSTRQPDFEPLRSFTQPMRYNIPLREEIEKDVEDEKEEEEVLPTRRRAGRPKGARNKRPGITSTSQRTVLQPADFPFNSPSVNTLRNIIETRYLREPETNSDSES